MSETDVHIDRVGKRYKLGTHRHASEFWALRDVSFDVVRGSSTAVIGRNGAGKSTLLKLLAGITTPTEGRIVVHGRLAALIEVGSGFHPELTGRENVFLSGAILGMGRRELAKKLESIVEFAGVEAFVDTPVKWYSSGMYVRLGFSIAAHLEPDILLVDEVLAVGDAEFQIKCLKRIRELKAKGVTIIFISHDLTAVEQLCDTAVLFEKGKVVASGRPEDVVADYHRRIVAAEKADGEFVARARDSDVSIASLSFRRSDADERDERTAWRTGAPLTVSLRYTAKKPVADLVAELTYYSSDGKTLLARASAGDASHPVSVVPPGGVIEFTCPALPLKPGAYYVGAVLREASAGDVLDWWDGGTMLYVEPGADMRGLLYMPHSWRIVHAGAGATAAGPLLEASVTTPA
jgi:ABC-type polysaccharide/polyol phosphate transport system ATPase subunit